MGNFFDNRTDGGEKLGRLILAKYHLPNPIVYALPRGGVVTAYQVAKILHAPLQLTLVKKITPPNNREWAISVVSEHGYILQDKSASSYLDKDTFYRQINLAKKEILLRRLMYSQVNTVQIPRNRNIILIDDGVATGLSMRAAICDLEDYHPNNITIACPIILEDSASKIRCKVNRIITFTEKPANYMSISQYYKNFEQLEDNIVLNLLKRNYIEQSRMIIGNHLSPN